MFEDCAQAIALIELGFGVHYIAKLLGVFHKAIKVGRLGLNKICELERDTNVR